MGLVRKTAVVLAGLISVNVTAIVALVEDSGGLKEVRRYWD
ncbi:MAG: hypothetical protein ACFCUE_13185 [Candidatus Bathyarchaeia archaeon]|jgi:hypothetical protein